MVKWFNTRYLDILTMKSKTKEGIALMALIMGVIATPIAFDQAADAIAPNRTFTATPDTFYLKGDLTAPAGEAPFGGKVVGDHLVRVNGNQISIVTSFDANPSAGMVYEGWLVDMATGYKLSLGQFLLLFFNCHDQVFFVKDDKLHKLRLTEENFFSLVV